MILHPDDSVLREDRIVAGVHAGQRHRVRAGRLSPGSSADLDEDDRLAALGCELSPPRRLVIPLEAFDEAGDRRVSGWTRRVTGEVGEVQIGLVPSR